MIDSLRYYPECAVSFLPGQVYEVGVARVKHDRSRVLSGQSQILHGLQPRLDLRVESHHRVHLQLDSRHQKFLVGVSIHKENDV